MTTETISFEIVGLSAESILEAIEELRLMSTGCRSRTPLVHHWASPSRHYSKADWHRQRNAHELEFDLRDQPYLAVYQLKFGEGGRAGLFVCITRYRAGRQTFAKIWGARCAARLALALLRGRPGFWYCVAGEV